jgi:hypothetical protein
MSLLQKIFCKIIDFCYEKKGSILVEFAFIMPVLLIIFIGSIETTNYLGVNRRINSAAYTVADLIGRFEVVDSTIIENVWKSAALITSPSDFETMSSVISSVKLTSGNYVVEWSKAKGTGVQRGVGSTVSESELGGNLINEGETILLIDIRYGYQPVITQNLINFSGVTLKSHIVMKPRRISSVVFCESPKAINPTTGVCQ